MYYNKNGKKQTEKPPGGGTLPGIFACIAPICAFVDSGAADFEQKVLRLHISLRRINHAKEG